MKIHDIIHKIFNEYPIAVTPILTGLTNHNYIVQLKNQTIVLRVPKPENESIFDYKHEAKVLEMIQPYNLDTPLVYYNKHSGIKCSTYIPNSETFVEKYTQRAVRCIQSLHSLELRSGKIFNIPGTINHYRSLCTNPQYDLSIYDSMINTIKQENLTLCHNDCVKGNFLFTDTKDYLIDYEYAMDNDPLFDLMSFITENDIQTKSTRDLIYSTYFDTPITLKQHNKLHQYEIVHHIIWCTWAMMMSETDPNPEYITIQNQKYKRLLEAIERGPFL